jgi:hypothetical protein
MWKVMMPALAVVAALAATNPNEYAHSRHMVVHARDSCGGNPLNRMLCGGIAALASAGLRYDDYLLYSTAELGETRTIGVLGKIVVVGD